MKRRALFTIKMILPVQNEEDAGMLAAQVQQAVEDEIHQNLERLELTLADAEDDGVRILGTSVDVWEDP